MLRKFALIVAAGSALFFSAAYALGLGEIDVDSHLNQKFSASIPLNSISPEEAENLLVRLADSDDFNKAGIERSDYLSSLNFKVVTDAKNSRIVISSKQLAREPFLSFLLDVRSSTGRVLREYTVLLDPPAYAQTPTAPAAAAPAPAAKTSSDFYQTADEANQSKTAAAPVPTPAPAPVAPAPKATPKPAPAASAPAPAPAALVADAAAESDSAVAYGPVKAQETFWSIATKLRPNASVTMDQMLWALYSANPQAFEGKSITGLLKGSTLKVPPLSSITAVSPAAATAHLQELKGHRAAAPKKAAPVASAEEAAPAPKLEPAAAPKPASKPAIAEKKTVEPVAPPPAAAAPAKPAAPAPAPAPAPAAKAAVTPPPPAPAPAPAAAPEPAAAPVAAPAAEGVTPDASSATPAAVPAEPEPEVPAPKPVKKSVEPASSALADDWMAPAIAGAIVLILALLGVRFWQKKQTEKGSPVEPVLTSKASSNLQFWKRAAESAPTATGKFAVPPPPPPSVAKPAAAKSILDVPPPPPKPSNPLWDETTMQAAAPQAPAFDLTQTMDRPSESPNRFAETGVVDEFNTTNQFDNDTVKVDLEANDPVSEADFHLAYGLYDEAALLLESAVEKNPNRTDIRVKLAETYFRANKPHEFEDIAQSLKPHLDANEWQKIAIMGSQLLPDSPLYKGAAGETLDNSVDLAFDEPVDLGAAETQIFSSTATSMPSQPSTRANPAVLDFKLEDLEAPQVTKPAPASAPPPARGGETNTLEFNLTDFDLSSPAASKPAAPAVAEAAAPAAAPAKTSNAVEFDMGGFDLESPKPAGDAAALGDDINLDDFDLGELADDSHAISAGDEAGTKLDLARAYVDMGDNDMARSLLTEVLVQGSEEQKTEAQALIQRLA